MSKAPPKSVKLCDLLAPKGKRKSKIEEKLEAKRK